MKLSITQNQYNQCNAGYFGNTLSKDQSGKTPKKPNSGIFKSCAQCNMEPEEKALKPAEKAFGKYEGRVNGALKSVIKINSEFFEYAQLKAHPDLVNTKDKKLLSRIDKAQKEIKALDKQAKPLLDGLTRGKVEDVDAKKLRDDRAVKIFAEGATNLDLHLLRTNFKAIKIVKQATGEWGKKIQMKQNPQINPDQSHDNQKVEKNLQINADDIQIENEVQENPQLDPDQSQTNQEDPFRSDVRSINRLVKAEQKRRIAEQKQPEKMEEIKEAKSEFVHKNQVTGNTNPQDKPTDFQTPKAQSGDEDPMETHSSDYSVKETTGNENSQVDPLKAPPPLVQPDDLNQTDQQQQIKEN